MHSIVQTVTDAIVERSKKGRSDYLQQMQRAHVQKRAKTTIGLSNLAHAIAPLEDREKQFYQQHTAPNIAIVTAYNDMLSAHQPYATFPPLIKRALMDVGATAQVAGGVPAMCDGVTQSQDGMELSLFSRETIAMSTAVALSHNVYDGAIYLGVCDKIVPGLVMAALRFGHLPSIFLPSGPMPSGISNATKAQLRQEFAQGKIGEEMMLETEMASYHSSGTCTFYGTANSNQMLMEMMGLQLPGSFVNTATPLREALTLEGTNRLGSMNIAPLYEIVDERSFVNAIVGLLATGGSSNHTIHLIAMAKAAGITLTWDDFDALSSVVPLLCRLYPNGEADVNNFEHAGGLQAVFNELLDAGFLHEDVMTVMGKGLDHYRKSPTLENQAVEFVATKTKSSDPTIIASCSEPFSSEGGLVLLKGNLGESIMKVSALKDAYHYIKAPAMVFESQEALQSAFNAGALEKDFVAVIRFQGPKANGMPELHGLMAPLGALQDQGFKVAIVTDGRMSGASGKVASAIHLSPEGVANERLAKVENGDLIELDIAQRSLNLLVDEDLLQQRVTSTLTPKHYGVGRELFSMMRSSVSSAKTGATIFDLGV